MAARDSAPCPRCNPSDSQSRSAFLVEPCTFLLSPKESRLPRGRHSWWWLSVDTVTIHRVGRPPAVAIWRDNFTAYKKRGFNHEGRMARVHCWALAESLARP